MLPPSSSPQYCSSELPSVMHFSMAYWHFPWSSRLLPGRDAVRIRDDVVEQGCCHPHPSFFSIPYLKLKHSKKGYNSSFLKLSFHLIRNMCQLGRKDIIRIASWLEIGWFDCFELFLCAPENFISQGQWPIVIQGESMPFLCKWAAENCARGRGKENGLLTWLQADTF